MAQAIAPNKNDNENSFSYFNEKPEDEFNINTNDIPKTSDPYNEKLENKVIIDNYKNRNQKNNNLGETNQKENKKITVDLDF